MFLMFELIISTATLFWLSNKFLVSIVRQETIALEIGSEIS